MNVGIAMDKSLIPVRKIITRGGKSFMTTVYVASTAKEAKENAKHTSLVISPTKDSRPRNVSRSTVEFMMRAEEVIDFAPDDKLAVDKVLALQSKYFAGKEEASMYDVLMMATEEIEYALSHDSDSGREWYKEAMDKTRTILSTKYPNLAGDTEWDFFLGILSVLSPGVKPKQNLAMALSVYDVYSSTGKIPIKNPATGLAYSVASTAILKKFSKVMLSFPSKGDFVAFMNGISTVGDVNALGGIVKGQKDEAAYNSMIFGEKVGMFYQSMRGTDGAVAVDRWAIRSFYRWTGKLRAEATGKELDDRIGAQDRKAVEYIMQTVGEKLKLSPSETQAVMWYYEKRLYRKLGFPERSFGTEDYATAAESIFMKKSMDGPSVSSLIRDGRMPTFNEFLKAIMLVKRGKV